MKYPPMDNHSMGTVFEELVRKFNEENNEEAGEHFTPRDVVRLMTNLIFRPIADDIRDTTRRGFARMWDEVVILTGMDADESREFVAVGMLLNVAAAMGLGADCPDDLVPRRHGGFRQGPAEA